MATDAVRPTLRDAALRAAPQGEEKVSNNKRLSGDPEARALDSPGDGWYIRPGGQAHFAALEIDRDRRGAGAGGSTGDGFDAAVAIHAGDLEDEFLSHVI